MHIAWSLHFVDFRGALLCIFMQLHMKDVFFSIRNNKLLGTSASLLVASNKCLTSSNKKLLVTSASLLVTSALPVVTTSF